MARKKRMADGVITMRADELKTCKIYRGKKIYFGQGRPPLGHIGFITALAHRTKYSKSIILRSLAGHSRAGPRNPLDERIRRSTNQHSLEELKKFANEAYIVASGILVKQGRTEDSLFDERMPSLDRITRCIEVIKVAIENNNSPRTAPNGGYWEMKNIPKMSTRNIKEPIEKVSREALLDAIANACSIDGTFLQKKQKDIAMELRRQMELTES